MNDITDWQGIAEDRGRALLHGAREYTELQFPGLGDNHEKDVLVREVFEGWMNVTADRFSDARGKLDD